MAHIMKISVVKTDGENIIIPLIESESLEEFRVRADKNYNLKFNNEHFSNMFMGLSLEDNLFSYLNSQTKIIADNHKSEETTDFIYEIHLNENDDVVTNNPIEFEISVPETMETDPTPTFIPLLDINHAEPPAELSDIFQIQSDNVTLQILPIGDEAAKPNVAEPPEAEPEKYSYVDIESKLREIHETEDASDLCRLCAKSIVDVKPTLIYGDEGYSDKINKVLPISVQSDDGLPQQMCSECTQLIEQQYGFVQKVLDADKILRSKFTAARKPMSDTCSLISELLSKGTVHNLELKPIVKPKPDCKFVTLDTEDAKTQERFKCQLCDLMIDDADTIVKHCSEAHIVNGLVACALCNYGFETAVLLSAHINAKHRTQLESKVKRYQCTICSRRYTSLSQIQKHVCVKNKNRSLHCEVCNKEFPTKVRLNFHRQFHLKNSRPLNCHVCNTRLEDENEYFDHLNYFHDTKQVFVCDICGKIFNMRAMLHNHKKLHADVRFTCKVCDKAFMCKQTLKDHEVSHTDTKPFQCDTCGKNMNRLSRLKQHLLTHELNPVVNDLHMCSMCKEAFDDEQQASEHQFGCHPGHECIEILSTDRVFRCEYCEKCFVTADVLNEHRSKHSGNTPYSCNICNATFASYTRCLKHKSTHGSNADDHNSFPVVKHFLCDQCGKSYLQWSYLGLHRRLKHSTEDPGHKCCDCHVTFPTSWALMYHRKVKHGVGKLKCDECGQFLANPQVLRNHKRIMHSEKKEKELQCDKCGKIFDQISMLESHLKLHQGLRVYKCMYCSRSFMQHSTLIKHIKVHKEGQYTCAYCCKKFDLRIDCIEHEAMHVRRQKFSCEVCDEVFETKAEQVAHSKGHGERPFTCDLCGLTFRRLFTLRNHKAKHKKNAGSFVLMVDMNEDHFENEPKEVHPSDYVQANIDDPPVPESILGLGSAMTGSYIDLGNGNYLPLQGNTISIDGKQYFLINDQSKTEDAPQIQMIVDDSVNDMPGETVGEQFANNTVMLVDDSSLILNQNQVQPEYVFATDTTLKPNTTFIVQDQMLLEADDQSFQC